MAGVIEAEQLVKRYGDFEAVHGIDFSVAEGSCFGLLGPNGAGKSTTIRMICCLAEVSAGRLTVLGHDAHPGNLTIKRQLGVVSQEDYLDPSLTVRENVELHGRFYGMGYRDAKRRAQDLLVFLQLDEKGGEQVRSLSGGMRRRAVIARALMGRPRLLILDEPTTGLDPQARILVWSKIRELKQDGVTILLTTHYMDEAQRLADDLVVIDHGNILERGTPGDLIARVVGADCLEIAECDPTLGQSLVDHSQAMGAISDWQGDSLMLFATEMDPIIARLQAEKLLPPQYYRRRASLEDVFLRLTGRDLRE